MGNHESISTSGAPTITFAVEGDTIRAELAGAKLYAEAASDERADLRVTDATGFVLADLVVNRRAERNLTENVMDVGSALLWSHWRYLRSAEQDSDRRAAACMCRNGVRLSCPEHGEGVRTLLEATEDRHRAHEAPVPSWTPTPAFIALREAWLDVPWNGVVEKGDTVWMQPLINAVSAIVDPDRQLRETDEAKRRGMLAEHKAKYTRYHEQMKLAQGLVEKFGAAHAPDVESWKAKCDDEAAACLAEFGVDLGAAPTEGK